MAKAKIMIVEDETIVAKELKIILEDMDYTVTSIVNSGEQAIGKAEQDCPDLILMDIRLNGPMDGIEAAERIRSRLGIPVVFLTAYAGEDKLERAKLTMPFGYILKPFKDKDLKIAVEIALYTATVDAKRKQAEKALQESEEKYRSLVESTEDSIYLVDENCNYLFMNEKHISRFNLSIDEIVGRNYIDFHSKEATKEFVEKIVQVIESGESLSYEHKSENDGRHFIRTLSPVRKPGEEINAVTIISKDITERLQADEALRRSNEELLIVHNRRKILSKRLIDLLEKDRLKIAMELHDHIGQTLASLKMNLEMIHGQIKPAGSKLEIQISHAKEKAIQVLKEIRNVSHGLRPTVIDALGLVPSLRGLFNEIQQRMDFKIQFFQRGIPEGLEDEKEMAIYRIIQEAFSNIVKHARAKNVFVNLIRKDDNLLLSVEDDGDGFDTEKAIAVVEGKGSLGLLIMHERVVQLDGEFTIESQIGKGTHLLVEIPL